MEFAAGHLLRVRTLQGLQAIEMRSGQTMSFEGGTGVNLGTMPRATPFRRGTLVANHSFRSLLIMYGGCTLPPIRLPVFRRCRGFSRVEDLDREADGEPELAQRNGRLVMEQGLHQDTGGRPADRGDTRYEGERCGMSGWTTRS